MRKLLTLTTQHLDTERWSEAVIVEIASHYYSVMCTEYSLHRDLTLELPMHSMVPIGRLMETLCSFDESFKRVISVTTDEELLLY